MAPVTVRGAAVPGNEIRALVSSPILNFIPWLFLSLFEYWILSTRPCAPEFWLLLSFQSPASMVFRLT
jgi:hypothetical protein